MQNTANPIAARTADLTATTTRTAATRRVARFTVGTLIASIGLSAFNAFAGTSGATAAPLPTIPPVITIPPLTIPPVTLGTIPPVTLGTIPPVISIPPVITIPPLATKNLSVSISNGVAGPHTPGTNLVYTINVRNNWSAAANGVGVLNPVPSGLADAIWSCTATPGSGCGGPANGAGAINRSVNLDAGGKVTFTVSARVTDAAAAITNTVTLAVPGGFGDINAADNAATDTDPVALPVATTTIAPTTTVPAAPAPVPATPAPTTPPSTVPAPTAPAPTAPAAPAPANPATTAPTPQTIVVIVKTEPASTSASASNTPAAKTAKKGKKAVKKTVKKTAKKTVAKKAASKK